ncbi:hypothetical protein BDV24DRAFT_141333 [Aspergillus arachidicola]|uniref:Uncharacterized protein n=1 Tax=Aspergillus arachidicola TaxID=656916 RepID=A0A5N6XUF5_9EURO|nr:hypothetical protein BDV24DRAFT_141333 [Aspergillus arachidicola]
MGRCLYFMLTQEQPTIVKSWMGIVYLSLSWHDRSIGATSGVNLSLYSPISVFRTAMVYVHVFVLPLLAALLVRQQSITQLKSGGATGVQC